YEQYLFSKVVALAEKAGKTVHLLEVPSSDIFQAIVLTAAQLNSAEIIAGRSSVMNPEQQAKRLGEAWEAIANKPREQIRFRVIGGKDQIKDFYVRAHSLELSAEEIKLIHEICRWVTRETEMRDNSQ